MTITEDELLNDLFDAYYLARKNKRSTVNQLKFEVNQEHYLFELHKRIMDRSYRPGKSICFMIGYPVVREVFAADFIDRIVHHLVYEYVNPIIEKSLIQDCYSCRKEKGTLYGIERLERSIRQCSDSYTKDCYIVKFDIASYFLNIDRAILYEKIKEILNKNRYRKVSFNIGCGEMLYDKVTDYIDRTGVKDPRYDDVLDFELIDFLVRIVVFNDPTSNFRHKGNQTLRIGLPKSKSMFTSGDGKGLPIGNLTSQLFSNVYLSCLDHFMKRDLKIKYYGRYVDDFFIISPDKKYLIALENIVDDFLCQNLELRLNRNKTYLQHYSRGVRFLGAYIKPYCRYILPRTREDFRHCLMHVEHICGGENDVDYDELKLLRAKLNSFLGYSVNFNAFNIRASFLERCSPLYKYYFFRGNYRSACVKREEYDKYIKKLFSIWDSGRY